MELAIFKSSRYQVVTADYLSHHGISMGAADIAGLHKILQSFQALPYENVSKLIRWRRQKGKADDLLRLPDTVWEEYRTHKLGGTCYSLTFFLETLLSNSGYNCYPVSCDMNWGKNVHCGLIVSCAGENWLCDPGYLLMTPLKLREVPQSIYRNQTSGVKLNFEGGRFYLSTFRGKKEKWRYSFRNIPCERDKFVKYWLKSFEQPGMNGICLTRQENGSMVYIHNNFIKEVNSHKISKRRVHGNWLGEIRQYFSIPRRFLEEACGITQERRQQ